MSLSSGLPGLILFSTPSMPAISMAAKAKYGLVVGSGQRNSMRLALPKQPRAREWRLSGYATSRRG